MYRTRLKECDQQSTLQCYFSYDFSVSVSVKVFFSYQFQLSYNYFFQFLFQLFIFQLQLQLFQKLFLWGIVWQAHITVITWYALIHMAYSLLTTECPTS